MSSLWRIFFEAWPVSPAVVVHVDLSAVLWKYYVLFRHKAYGGLGAVWGRFRTQTWGPIWPLFSPELLEAHSSSRDHVRNVQRCVYYYYGCIAFGGPTFGPVTQV